MKKRYIYIQLITVILLFAACNDSGKKGALTNKKETKTGKKDPETPQRPPIINIVDTVSIKGLVLCMKDSASSSERIGMKIRQIYTVKLSPVILKNKLKITGPPMAWYKNHKAPFFFESGIPVDKRPAKLPKGFYIKEIGTDSVVVAHFTGPYDLIAEGYEVLKDWLKDHKKISAGAPYEIYTDDPLDKDGNPKDPYKVQTDIIFPMRNK